MQQADIIKYAALILNENGEFLLGRKPGKDTWINIGGGIRNGETPFTCLQREIREELNCEIEMDPLPTYHIETPATPALDDPGKTVKIIWYKVKLIGEPMPIDELEEVKWIKLSEYQSYKLSPQIVEYLIPTL